MIVAELPAVLLGQVAQQGPKFTKWGVSVTFRTDGTTRLVFPPEAELKYPEVGSFVGVLIQGTLPSQEMGYWSFDTALVSETADEPLPQEVPLARHQPVIARKVSAGVWGVFCDACSHDEGEYVYPCRMGVQGLWQDNPPEELVEVE